MPKCPAPPATCSDPLRGWAIFPESLLEALREQPAKSTQRPRRRARARS